MLVVSIAAASCAFFAVAKIVEPRASSPNETIAMANTDVGNTHFDVLLFARLREIDLCIMLVDFHGEHHKARHR